MSMPVRDALLAFTVACAWGVNFVVIYVALESWPPLLLAALRFTFTALPLVLVVPPPRGVDWRLVVGVGVFMSGGPFALLFVGIHQGVPPGLASLLLQLQMVFTLCLAVVLLGERPRRVQLVGAAVAFAGLALIANDRVTGVPAGALWTVIAAAASWGVGNICARAARAPSAVGLLVWSSLVPPLPLLALSLSLEGPAAIRAAFARADPKAVLALAYVVVIASLFGFAGWNALLRRHPATSVTPFALLVPVVGIATAWLCLGERPHARALAGSAVVIAGLALTLPRVAARQPHRP